MLSLLSLLHAREGMWLPEQIPSRAQELQQLGLQIPAADLADPARAPLGAIVHVGGWCSGSFASAEGLVLTNHHCVWDQLQHNTTTEHNRLQDGYAATGRAQELSAGPGAWIYLPERNEDVTAAVMKRVKPGMSDLDRQAAIQREGARLVDACEKQQDRACEFTEELGGLKYRLLTQRIIRDVRIVYAPPMSVGSFGGDRDNFEWPRHDGDFAVLRAYVAPDGSSAEYSTANVPYRPQHWLRVNPAGIKPGEFVMVAGYPGGTQRYERAEDLQFLARTAYPARVQTLRDIEAILQDEVDRSPEAAARLGAHQQELANGRKYYQGILDNVAGSDVLQRKEATEAALMTWINGDPARKAKYGPAIEELRAWSARYQSRFQGDMVLRRGTSWISYLDAARTIVHNASERAKKDLDRDDGYRNRDQDDLRAGLDSIDAGYWAPAERQVFSYVLKMNAALPPGSRVKPLEAVDPAALDRLFTPGLMDDPARRAALLSASTADLQKLDDPWIRLALQLEPLLEEARAFYEEYDGVRSRLSPLWMDALLTWNPASTYPDANNTLRVTYGSILGYSPRDAVQYAPQTTVSGMLAKAASPLYEPPPAWVLENARKAGESRFRDAALGDVPVCFTSDLDTTGGNSGSATMNARGELVGLLFDGNYESMAADWLFDPATTRSIHVDIRYVLFTIQGTQGAGWVVDELIGGAR